MPIVMAACGIQVATSVENDEEQKFRNSISCTMPQSLVDARHTARIRAVTLKI